MVPVAKKPIGDNGNDALIGGSNDDRLDGGAGVDVTKGGAVTTSMRWTISMI